MVLMEKEIKEIQEELLKGLPISGVVSIKVSDFRLLVNKYTYVCTHMSKRIDNLEKELEEVKTKKSEVKTIIKYSKR